MMARMMSTTTADKEMEKGQDGKQESLTAEEEAAFHVVFRRRRSEAARYGIRFDGSRLYILAVYSAG
ncbi:unnamed protein product [Discosporangium mesarthrocarpum]